MATVLFTTGDIFERGAHLTVLPCSAAGHISRTAEKQVEKYNLSQPPKIPLGTIQVHIFPGAGRDTQWIAWAASVMNFTSSVKIIQSIGRCLGEYVNDHPDIQIIESTLLGTGAGALDPIDAGLALKRGFEETCLTDATLFVYGQISTIINEPRKASLDNRLPLSKTTRSPLRNPLVDNPVEIFSSYAHKDEDLMDDVRKQLIVDERNGRILKWHDRKIPPGTEWRTVIDERLKTAHIIPLFLSKHFIESKYCYELEGQIALQRHTQGEARAIPIILRPCRWQETPFAELQMLPKDATPISSRRNRDQICLEVANSVMAVVDELTSIPS